jgi:DNA-binding Lrp family transcriptional regulator
LEKVVADLSARVLELVASGQAASRTEIAKVLGAAPSTVSHVVGQLLEHGILAEEGTDVSTGGRPRKVLRIGGVDEYAVAADVGGGHARIGVVLPGGALESVANVPFALSDGPTAGLQRLAALLERLADDRGREGLRGVGLSLPGPVDVVAGVVDLPTRP